MKTRIARFAVTFLIVFMGFDPCYAQDEIENLLENGGFETGAMDPWTTYGGVTVEVVDALVGADIPEDPIEGTYCLHLDVTTLGANNWDVGLKHGGHVFEQGKQYTLSAFVKCSDGTLDIRFKPERDADPWQGYPEQIFTMTDEWQEFSVTSVVHTQTVDPAAITFHVGFEVADFWIDAVRFYEGEYVPPVLERRLTARDPIPEDGTDDVPRDTALSWTPGPFADKHNVYFGTDTDDANNADTDNPMDVLVSQEQAGTTYDPPGLLDFGQTYYWRIDEVNAPPDSTVFKGDLWSFTVEPFVYPIPGDNITATASSFDRGKGAENTINGSGLSDDLHSTITETMWLSLASEPNTAWILFEFNKIYKLNQMWVWNYNAESLLSLYGLKEVALEHSIDGSDWTKMDNVTEFAAAPGTDDYAHNITVDFNDAPAKYVRITAIGNQGGNVGFFNQYGLSEVKFFYVPVNAREPEPATGATDVALDVTLRWRPGREASSHDVYIADNIRAVVDRTADLTTVNEASYGPLDLNLGTTYYWSVDEVNGLEIWESDIWSFTTEEYFVLDDFEDYNDFPPDEIWNTWIDGFEDLNNGSTAGYPDPEFAFDEHFVETTIVHGGDQSMPYFYDNTTAPKSEVTRTMTSYRDWTQKSINELSLWYYGDQTNAAEPMYVTLNGSARANNDDAAAAQVTDWTEWRIALQDFADQGLDLSDVSTVTIGFGDGSPGGLGLVFFDDIRLYGSP